MSPGDALQPVSRSARVGRFALRHAKAIAFIVVAMCGLGIYCASTMPSSVFPQTNFPRVVILVDNGVMPADEMMATITRPIEEAMKGIPGVVNIRSTTARGSADVNVFFTWQTDMVQAELYVLSRLAQAKATLPSTVTTQAYRLTFSAFPIVGVSLTGQGRSLTDLWQVAQYQIKPRFLRIGGVARVDLVGGRTPEYHVVADPTRLQAYGLSLAQVADALTRGNLVAPAGMREERHTLYLTVVDSRARGPREIEELTVGSAEGGVPIRVKDVAQVTASQEPVFNVVTADGEPAVLLNVRSQPDGSTLDIAAGIRDELRSLRKELPPGLKLAFFYDQSILVNESVRSVWEAIGFGLLLSIVILYLFLRDWGSTSVAIVVIPVTVLTTLVAMRLAGMTFNLMTLGGIAAAIGLVIDDAIVVVEAIFTKVASGQGKQTAIQGAVGGILLPLLGSTLTPVVVFVPLAFLEGVPGVFFRALALTMAVALVTSLVLALTLTPSLAGWIVRGRLTGQEARDHETGGPVLRRLIGVYEWSARAALRSRWTTVGVCGLLLLLGVFVYPRLSSDFLPELDEGGFVIDYVAPPGTSLAETDRALLECETILKETPEVESYSRRTGAALGFHVVEPNTGDFLVKLRPSRKRPTQDVIAELREKFQESQPAIEWEFPGILGDLIGDLTWSPEPIEIKLFSTDLDFLKETAPKVEEAIKAVPGVVDSKDGLIIAGPSISLRVRQAD
ncbi:MAG TPA: efflux RND transporter permease subunit, partial [Tepidisphaeraceae bacterium]